MPRRRNAADCKTKHLSIWLTPERFDVLARAIDEAIPERYMSRTQKLEALLVQGLGSLGVVPGGDSLKD